MLALLSSVALAAAPVTLDFRGTLGEALNEIATQGEINLIATGAMGVQAEVHLKEVPAEDALRALAKVHHLELHQEGALWLVKPADSVGGAAIAPSSVADVPTVQHPAESTRDDGDSLREDNEPEASKAAEKAKRRVRNRGKHGGKVNTGPLVVRPGDVAGDAVAFGGPVTVTQGAVVDGDAVAFGGDVIVEDGARINGDAVSFGGTVHKADGAVITGEEVSFGMSGLSALATQPSVLSAHSADDATDERVAGTTVGGFLLQFAVMFGLGFLLMMVAPQRMRSLEAEVRQQPVKSALAGFIGLLASIPVTLMLCITIIGIPIAMVLWAAAGVALLMGLVAVANAVGAKLPFRRRHTQAVVMAAGLLAIMLAQLVPVLGPLVVCAATFMATGALIRTRLGQRSYSLPIAEAADTTPMGAAQS